MDKVQLRAFSSAGLIDTPILKKIDEHFAEARELEGKFQAAGPQGPALTTQEVFLVPLLRRTTSMVETARKLEEYREQLFSSLHLYELLLASFLQTKRVTVGDDGRLAMVSTLGGGRDISSHQLSSGEKQILIFLTQALVGSDRPLVFIADEPELSLHVTWQEKLLPSIRDLASTVQIIIATHSPDIVGKDIDKVIDLGKGGK